MTNRSPLPNLHPLPDPPEGESRAGAKIAVMPPPERRSPGRGAIPQTLAAKAWSFLKAGDVRGFRQAVERRWPLVKRVLTGPIGPGAMVLDLTTDLGVGGAEEIRECVDPNNFTSTELALHVAPYRFALAYATGKDVLEVGCNWGYGSHLLSGVANRVVGMDLNPEAVACGLERFAQPNLELMVHDASHPFPFPGESFDLVFSSEVFEHIANYAGCLAEMRRVLRPGGTLILKTPNLAYAPRWHALNPYHRKVFVPRELRQLLETQFQTVEMHGYTERYERSLRQIEREFDPFSIPFEERIPGSFTVEVETWVEPRLVDVNDRIPSNLLAVCREPKAQPAAPQPGTA
jgi:ubiquinone/menaquinone biosynthesis C-methylase UbiE